MAVSYLFKPGERINEGALARRLGVSRTPLREALNRLNTEGLLNALPGKGFFCRDLDVREIFSLYEMRKVIEAGSARLAVVRARDAAIDADRKSVGEGQGVSVLVALGGRRRSTQKK